MNIDKLKEEIKGYKTKQKDNIDLSLFLGKKVMTFGTFDLLHIGHKKIIDHALRIAGKEENLVIGVSSDRWNNLKGKAACENQEQRREKILKSYPKAKVIFEDHFKAEETWPLLWDEHNISLIVMGGDHVDNLSYINKIRTPKGAEMKISFFERTPKISSTLLRELSSK